ncbi:restriction endonuclease subunit S [Polaromonas sp. P1-6]|nr:restriction endonuclease subunit S [Polaromonas sp. P1-6]
MTIGNVSSGRLNFTNSRFVPHEYFDKITPYRRPEIGDLLYTVVGASYGRPVVVETDQPFCVQRHIAILKPAAELQGKYLHLLLRSPFVYDQATGSLTGTAQPTIPLRPLRNFLVPLPPLAEQHRIVARVDELMALCDQLEAQLTTTQTDSRKLLEAVLRDALDTSAAKIAGTPAVSPAHARSAGRRASKVC